MIFLWMLVFILAGCAAQEGMVGSPSCAEYAGEVATLPNGRVGIFLSCVKIFQRNTEVEVPDQEEQPEPPSEKTAGPKKWKF